MAEWSKGPDIIYIEGGGGGRKLGGQGYFKLAKRGGYLFFQVQRNGGI